MLYKSRGTGSEITMGLVYGEGGTSSRRGGRAAVPFEDSSFAYDWVGFIPPPPIRVTDPFSQTKAMLYSGKLAGALMAGVSPKWPFDCGNEDAWGD